MGEDFSNGASHTLFYIRYEHTALPIARPAETRQGNRADGWPKRQWVHLAFAHHTISLEI
jgi:hypothetical protein